MPNFHHRLLHLVGQIGERNGLLKRLYRILTIEPSHSTVIEPVLTRKCIDFSIADNPALPIL